MISGICAGFLVIAVGILIRVFRLFERTKEALSIAGNSLDVVRSPDLTDDDKAIALQKHAIQLFRLFLILAVYGSGALLLPLGILWFCSLLMPLSLNAVLAVAVSPRFIIVCCVLSASVLFLKSRFRGNANRYSALDRLLHRVAFLTYRGHIPLADIETRLYSKHLTASVDRPVFVTALPRAGTTLLLECCAHTPEFATHCYRDMPFVLTPCLWNDFSARFGKSVERVERAHRDGMWIDLHSPEALEEVLWQAFWRTPYHHDCIKMWGLDQHEEFEAFFRDHMRKIIYLRQDEAGRCARYVSKNNLNIARIPWLQKCFPEATIIVPFRAPIEQASSLLNQHQNFLNLHREDRFASTYMRAIGHFDFGNNLRPVDFNGWWDQRTHRDPEALAFWLEYWIAGYQYLLSLNTDRLHFVQYEKVCKNPEQQLRALADVIGMSSPETLLSSAPTIHLASPRAVDAGSLPQPLVEKANALHAKLEALAL